MKISYWMAWGSMALMGWASVAARAETKVELKGVHFCCGRCVKAAEEVLKTVDGVTATCDQKARTVSLSAKDDAAAQKALESLAAKGFYGETGNKDVSIKDDSGATKGKVKSLTVMGAHNCCGTCCRALKVAVQKVEGVTGDTAKPKAESFEVTGDFDALELVKAIHAAGFHVKVKP